MDFGSVLAGGIIAPILLWFYSIGLAILKIRFHGFKQAKAKVFKNYPWYKMPWYKKFLFLGLKDAVPKSYIVVVYICHFTLIICVGIHIACLAMLQSALLRIFSIISGFIFFLFLAIETLLLFNMEINIR